MPCAVSNKNDDAVVMSKKTKKVNTGKIFESAIKDSIPEHCLIIRLPDPPQAFSKSNLTRFSHKNPCDYLCYNSHDGKLWCLELKTTASKSMSFENIHDDAKESKMIHAHQTKALLEFSKFDGVVAGFLFNFRHFEGEPNYVETTYFMEANDFQRMCDKIGKKSFNECDVILNGGVKVRGDKKRVRYKWDVESLFESYSR